MFSIGNGADFTRRTGTFQNPIAAGADPWVVRHGGFYYWCLSEADLGVAVYRSTSLISLGDKSIVWRAPASGPYSAQIWAPELHLIDGRWYIYVAASNGRNESHRMIVLQSDHDDPTKGFYFKSELYTGDDFVGRRNNRWAIDGTVLEHDGGRYFLWSGWAGERDEQSLYIAPMTSPWTLGARRVRICANDDHLWERVGGARPGRGLNEGPQVLKRAGRVFVVYSCSGSWEPSYKLGMLELTRGSNPLHASSWRKHDRPVFESSRSDACGVGHCSFTCSPDGTEDWMVFHAKISPTHGWSRAIHAQRFTWTAAGVPAFGAVLAPKRLRLPSGDAGVEAAAWAQTRSLVERVTVRRGAGEASGEPVAAS